MTKIGKLSNIIRSAKLTGRGSSKFPKISNNTSKKTNLI